MTGKHPHTLSRRKLLAGLGTVGIASAGAGLGTTAYFTDTESFDSNTLQAGELDLKLDYRATYTGGPGRLAAVQRQHPGAADLGDGVYLLGQAPPDRDDWAEDVDNNTINCETEGLINGDAIPVFDLADVKPGDEGEVTMSLHICDNPAYLRMNACVTADENGQSEPESAADSSGSDAGELAELIQVDLWYDDNCSNTFDEAETLIYRGSLAGLNDYMCEGLLLDGQGASRKPAPGDACVALGKLENPEGTVFTESEDADGSDHSLGTEHDDTYTLVAYTGDEVDVALSNFRLEDGELVGFDFTVTTDEFGVCRALVKSGTATEEYAYGACVDDGTLLSPLSGRPKRLRQQVSHVEFFVCEVGETDGETTCFAPGGHCVGLSWVLPADAGNEVQTDVASFDISFDAEQCRHNSTPFEA